MVSLYRDPTLGVGNDRQGPNLSHLTSPILPQGHQWTDKTDEIWPTFNRLVLIKAEHVPGRAHSPAPTFRRRLRACPTTPTASPESMHGDPAIDRSAKIIL